MTSTAPPPSLPLAVDTPATTKRLASAADVARALGELAVRERAIDARVESLLAGRADVERTLARLGDETAEVSDGKEMGGGARRGGGERRRLFSIGIECGRGAGWQRRPPSPPPT